MPLQLANPQELPAIALDSVALLGAPGATFDAQTGTRQLAPEGVERAQVAADVIGQHAGPRQLMLHAGYGAGYTAGGPQPSSYTETEAYAYETAVCNDLQVRHGVDLAATGWEIVPGEDTDAPFDPNDFSSSTAEEAFLIDRTYRRLGSAGLLGVIGGPLQLRRFAEAAHAMQLPIADRMIGITTSGAHENKIREHLVRQAYRRAILAGEQTSAAVLAREQAFFGASTVGKIAAVALNPVRSGRTASPQ